MQLILEESFLKSAKKLPDNLRTKLAKFVKLLETNPYHPFLHTKKLQGNLTGFYSFRVTRDWRVIFYFRGSRTIHVLEVDNRKDIYR